ncbi:eukaryotic translation initiation factor 1-like protein [Pisolithus orientalis]|uniref:eukaryotic translation initiation factor 1-like protein n=1 Tax=Pisolithus orientalis TaxID=936130 RepID=UPI002224C39C|nr:eukaryotic translation initiation factor 1-like protein [Pisolithus orientalis]KAI5999752.1 eukaryotic translation initiation factor 1-like protein [Pisolithus orientalis]
MSCHLLVYYHRESTAIFAIFTMSSETQPEPIQPVEVLYCKVCTFPPEYCEFGSSFTRCKEWLKESHPALYDKYYSDEALQSKLGTLSLEAQAKLEKDTAEKEAKAEKKADAALKKKMASQVSIKRMERNKRKFAFDVELKKASKFLAQKFATGASVTKNPQGQDEIVVQGDVAEDVLELIESRTREEKKKKGE